MSSFQTAAHKLGPVLVLGYCAIALIFGKNLTNPNGYITNDCASYLELAARLLSGHGFTVLNDGLDVADSTHFATWPVGYPSLIAAASLTICALALFLTRHIGLFALGPILAITTVHLARGSGITALRLGVAATAVASAVFVYLTYNKFATGFSTGVPRVPAHETNLELLAALSRVLFHELVLPIPFWFASDIRHNVLLAVTALALIYVAVRIARSPVNKPEPEYRNLCLSFLLVGLSYLNAIIVARWNAYFDPFGYRLLNPGVTLGLVGLFAALADCYSAAQTAIGGAMVLIAGISLAVHTIMLHSRAVPGGYKAALQTREETYGHLPSGTIVLYGSPHLRYQRPDVHILNPSWHGPLSITEDFSAMMTAFDTTRPVYVEVNIWAQNSSDQSPAHRQFLDACDPAFYIIRVRPEMNHWLCEPIARSSVTVLSN